MRTTSKALAVLALAILVCLWARPAGAVVTAVGNEATADGDDQALTFAAAPGATNHVFILTSMGVENNTISITGAPNTVTTLAGPIDSVGFAIRAYVFCYQGDGADTSVTVTTSAGGAAESYGAEFAGATCPGTPDDSENNDDSGDTNYELTTDLTTTVAGALIVSLLRSSSAANFAPGTGYTQWVTERAQSMAQYQIAGAAGTYDATATSAVAENALVVAVAVLAATGSNPNLSQTVLRSGQ